MSEVQSYREVYTFHYTGIDTARYAVTQCDSTLSLDVRSNGFHAVRRSLTMRNKELTLDVSSLLKSNDTGAIQHLQVELKNYLDTLASQLDMRGVDDIAATQPVLTLTVAQRECRKFVPRIDAVEFTFEGLYGIRDNVSIQPDTICIYGSAESLSHITGIQAAPCTLKVERSGIYRVALDPSWRQYSDLRSSADSIDISIPIEEFIGLTFVKSIQLVSQDSVQRVHLYPDKTQIHCLVPKRYYDQVDSSDFTVTAVHENGSGSYLDLQVSQFPAFVRIRELQPAQVQYTLIK